MAERCCEAMGRGLLRVVGGCAAALAITLAAALSGGGEAEAEGAAVVADVTCQGDGSYSITWTVTNNAAAARRVSATGGKPVQSRITPRSMTVASGSSGSFTQSGLAGSSTAASVTLHAAGVGTGGGSGSSNLSAAVSPDGSCRSRHDATAPTGADGTCASGGRVGPSVTIPADPGISYALDGEHASAGTRTVTPGRHRVSASSQRYHLDTAQFTLHVSSAPSCDAVAVLETPRAVHPACVTPAEGAPHSALPLPHSAGVSYGIRTTDINHVTVSATAAHGYRLPPQVPRGWTRIDAAHATFTLTQRPAAACAPLPQLLSGTSPCTGAACGTARIRNLSAVADAAPARRVPACGTNCVGPVVPMAPRFTDDTCATSTGQRSGASYTIRSMAGVSFEVNGEVIGAGTYPVSDGVTLTVVAAARPGYALSGITQWTHTFPVAPNCSGVSVKPRTPPAIPAPGAQPARPGHPATTSSPKPASTGSPVGQLLLVATALILLGSACFTAGSTRRRPSLATSTPAAGFGRTPPRPGLAAGSPPARWRRYRPPWPAPIEPHPDRSRPRAVRRVVRGPPSVAA